MNEHAGIPNSDTFFREGFFLTALFSLIYLPLMRLRTISPKLMLLRYLAYSWWRVGAIPKIFTRGIIILVLKRATHCWRNYKSTLTFMAWMIREATIYLASYSPNKTNSIRKDSVIWARYQAAIFFWVNSCAAFW